VLTTALNKKKLLYKDAGHVARVGELRLANNIVTQKYARKRPFERPGCRWKYNIWTAVKAFRLGVGLT